MKAASSPAAEYVAVASLRPWAKNPRKNDPAVKAVADSIKRFGFGAPLIARRENGEIIAGHTRLKAAIKLGLAEVPVRYLDLSEAEAHALALADNKVGELAEWDDAALADVLRDLTAADVSVEGLGFTAEEIAALIGGGDDPSDTPDPGAPEVEEGPAHSVAGEVYELGPHRLACGDSTDGAVWEALVGAERLRMVWTDPPYGVAIVGGKHALSPAERLARGGKVIENDALSPEDLTVFVRAVFDAVLARCEKGAAWYVATPSKAEFRHAIGGVLLALELWRWELIWRKNSFVMGRADYQPDHEAIFYGWSPGGPHYFTSDRTRTTVIDIKRPTVNKDHPTMKPVELVEAHIMNSSHPGWLVGDAFGGSGTTLLACARTGRVARLVELSPHYCDVIRRRWTRWAKEAGQEPGTGALDG
jgi:DNA modification methylase